MKPAKYTEVALRYALLVDRLSDRNDLLNALTDWQQSHRDLVDWIPVSLRPDLAALCGITKTPVFAAFLSDGRPVFVQPVTNVDTLTSRLDALQLAAKEQPLTILELANAVEERRMAPFSDTDAPPELSTMLVQEWLKRIVKTWKPSNRIFDSDHDIRIIETLFRFREKPVVHELLEVVSEKIPTTLDGKWSALQLSRLLSLAVVLYRSTFMEQTDLTIEPKELIDCILRIIVSLKNLRDNKTGLIRINTEETEMVSTVSEQSKIARALVQAGWVIGEDCWNFTSELMDSISHYAQFGVDGCRLVLPNGIERGLILSDGIYFAEAALDDYDLTGNTRRLGLAETVASVWHTRFLSQSDWLDWFGVGHPLHGTAVAIVEQGILSNCALRLGFTTGNQNWNDTGERLLANIGRFLLEYPGESVSFVEGVIRLFARDVTLHGPWQMNSLAAEWRIALLPWIPDVRIDWREPVPTPVIKIESQTIDVVNPLSLYRLFLSKETRRKT